MIILPLYCKQEETKDQAPSFPAIKNDWYLPAIYE